jgi:histone acetyltransferase (RNA polymerase elongator complex component)
MQRYIPLVYQIISELPALTPDRLKDLQRDFAKTQKMSALPSKSQILQAYLHLVERGMLEKNSAFEQLLRKRAIRSLSGIVSVRVLTKPRPCP